MATLIKRVKAMLNRHNIQFFLTSATLGDEKSNPQIIDFANSLCAVHFDEDSIIRSSTVAPAKPEITNRLDLSTYRELAEKIRSNFASDHILKFIREKGIAIYQAANTDEALEKTLYSMILHDDFYYDVRHYLLNKIKPLNQLAYELNVSIDNITDFIAVASKAKYNGDRIFEAKHHMFIRGIEGVYVTLNPSNILFIRKMETHKEDPKSNDCGFKVFEITFCHNCNSTYIVGQTKNGCLVQKSKFNDDYSPEVYLLDGVYDEYDEENENENKYIICAKCGAIERSSSINGLCCGHDKKNYNSLLKVKDFGDQLHTCPCCHVVNTQRSILRPFFLGNEAATAVISTALFNELPDVKITKKIITIEDPFFGSGPEKLIEERENLVKQFLTFSDNRQAAAFFATYLQTTYRENLIKRIMTKICEDNMQVMYHGVRLSTFVSWLEEYFEKYNIYHPDERKKQAWLAVLKELINHKALNALQNMGILYFDLNIEMSESKALLLSSDETTTLFKMMALHFIKEAAIKLPIILTKADYKKLSYAETIKGFNQNYTQKKYVNSWLPAAGRENVRTKLLRKLFAERDDNFILSLLKAIWNSLLHEEIIEYDSESGTYLLSFEAITVKTVDKLYICNECKTKTPYCLKNICANPRCNGSLVEYDYFMAMEDDHYYDVYHNLNIDDLLVKEHTAQLSSQQAYSYQNDFKNKKINVLSCSTTFEMGVDVGTLEIVFMRNMPPSPANYAQRAGRAGRSLGSAAYSLTYCPNSSHDQNYFKDPVSMIKGTIQPPSFNVDNEKIALRHIFASAFSFFWRKYKEIYKRTIGEFFDADGVNALKKYLESHPENLKEYLCNVLSPELQKHYEINTYGWISKLFLDDPNNPGVFDIAIKKYASDIGELEKARIDCTERQRKANPGSKEERELGKKIRDIGNSINTIKKQEIIEFLSRNNIIPKYGFPVDTVELKSFGRGGIINSLRLDRDLFTAISEYAPESEVVADGKLITSRYIRVLSGFAWPEYKYVICKNCNTLIRVF